MWLSTVCRQQRNRPASGGRAPAQGARRARQAAARAPGRCRLGRGGGGAGGAGPCRHARRLYLRKGAGVGLPPRASAGRQAGTHRLNQRSQRWLLDQLRQRHVQAKVNHKPLDCLVCSPPPPPARAPPPPAAPPPPRPPRCGWAHDCVAGSARRTQGVEHRHMLERLATGQASPRGLGTAWAGLNCRRRLRSRHLQLLPGTAPAHCQGPAGSPVSWGPEPAS